MSNPIDLASKRPRPFCIIHGCKERVMMPGDPVPGNFLRVGPGRVCELHYFAAIGRHHNIMKAYEENDEAYKAMNKNDKR